MKSDWVGIFSLKSSNTSITNRRILTNDYIVFRMFSVHRNIGGLEKNIVRSCDFQYRFAQVLRIIISTDN